MGIIVNLCEACTNYREQFTNYLVAASRGDYLALNGAKTILELALEEDRDSEVAKILQDNSGICDNENFCIYNSEGLRERLEGVYRLMEKARDSEMDAGEFLRLSYAITMLSELTNL